MSYQPPNLFFLEAKDTSAVIDNQGWERARRVPSAYFFDGFLLVSIFEKIHIHIVVVYIQIIEQALGLLAPSTGAEGIEGNIPLLHPLHVLHVILD
jgi:hypothetical protein